MITIKHDGNTKIINMKEIIVGETFEHFRKNEKKIKKAKELLKKNNFIVYKKKS
jgi:hypothetical protein